MSGQRENRAINRATAARFGFSGVSHPESGHESGHHGPIRLGHEVEPGFLAMNLAIVTRRATHLQRRRP